MIWFGAGVKVGGTGVSVGVLVRVGRGVNVGVGIAVQVLEGVGVWEGVKDEVGDNVRVAVLEGVLVGLRTSVALAVGVEAASDRGARIAQANVPEINIMKTAKKRLLEIIVLARNVT